MTAQRPIGTMVGALALAASLLGTHTGSAAAQTTARRHVTATQYSFQDVATPHDPTFTQLLGINDGNTIAGYDGSGQTVNGVLHPNKGFTLRLPHSFTSENYPAAAQTQVIGIDNAGDTDGFYLDRAGHTHAFLHMKGTFTTIDLPGTTFNQALGLNNRGEAAGYFQDAQGQNHAWIRDAHGTFLVPPIPNSQATGINDRGTVVGFTQPTTATSSGFIRQDNHLTLLNVPGSTFTQALGENNLGQIVGTYNDAQGNAHGFVYRHGHFQSVTVPGASATVINGINDQGRVVGFFTDAAGNTVGFAGTPGARTASTGGTGRPGGQGATVTVGLTLPLSGQDAALGLSAEHGAQLAIAQANAAHLAPGVTFALAAKDDAGADGQPDAATGASNIKALIADARVAGIIGPFDTPTALAELPLANRAPIALVSPSAGDPCLTSADPALGCGGANDVLPTVRPTSTVTFFRVLPTDRQQGSAQADYLSAIRSSFNNRTYTRVAVIDDATPYGSAVANAFASRFEADGGTVLSHVSVPEGTASTIGTLTQIAAQRPDVIFFGGSDPAMGTPLGILLRQQMVQVPSLANTAFAGADGLRTPQFAQTVGLAGGPVYSTLTPVDAASVSASAASTFAQQYQAAYGPLGRYSATGYDSATVLLTAIKAALAEGARAPGGATATAAATAFRRAVIAAVARTRVTGATGTLSFTAAGDLAQGIISIERLATVNGSPVWQQAANQSVP